MPSSSKYEIRLMRNDDFEQVLALLINSFFVDEPITHHLHVTNTSKFAENVLNGCLKEQCSFVAYDTETNQIVGVSLNEIVNKTSESHVTETNEQLHYILEILVEINQRFNIFDQFNAQQLMHIFMISVDKVARGHGLASQLNIPGAFAEATNVYSLNCFKQHKFDIFKELIYAEYDPERLAKLNNPMYDRCYLVGRRI